MLNVKVSRKQIKNWIRSTPEGQPMSKPATYCACPVCLKVGYAAYPYAEFVIKHEHPMKRYWYWIRTGRQYSKWLNEYWNDVKKFTGKTKKDYLNK